MSSMECFRCREAEEDVLSEDSHDADGVKSSLLRRARLGSLTLDEFGLGIPGWQSAGA